MTEPSTAATGLRDLAVRIRRTSLAVKITAVGALVTAAVVLVAFGALSVETRASARRVYADELSRHQRTLLLLQRQNLTQLISGAALITQSPTLRSALETYRVEANLGRATRRDLVQTNDRGGHAHQRSEHRDPILPAGLAWRCERVTTGKKPLIAKNAKKPTRIVFLLATFAVKSF